MQVNDFGTNPILRQPREPGPLDSFGGVTLGEVRRSIALHQGIRKLDDQTTLDRQEQRSKPRCKFA